MSRARRLTPREISSALALAARNGAAWALESNYTTGERTISYREPNDHTYFCSAFLSADFARACGGKIETALAHLVRLAAAGRVVEMQKVSNIRRFRLPRDQYDALAREIIAGLVAEGLPHDDDWRAARAAAREPS